MDFLEIKESDLLRLRDGLEMLLRVLNDEPPKIYLFATSQDPTLLDAAKEAVAEYSNEGINETQVEVAEIAIAVRLSGDVIYGLTGSGIKLKQENFVYQTGSEGIRELNFNWSQVSPVLTTNKLRQIALSGDDMHLDRFFEKFKSQGAPKNVQRSQPVTAPRLSSLLDEWLK